MNNYKENSHKQCYAHAGITDFNCRRNRALVNGLSYPYTLYSGALAAKCSGGSLIQKYNKFRRRRRRDLYDFSLTLDYYESL